MNIELKTNDASSIIKENSEALWKINSTRSWRSILVLLIISLFFILYGITNSDTDGASSISTDYSDGARPINQTITYYNYHFVLSVGIAFFLLSCLYSLHLRRAKKAFFAKSLPYLNKLKGNSNELLITFNDEEIIQTYFGINQRINWSVISKFIQYKNFLFLVVSHPNLATFAINKKYFSETQFAELKSFIKTRIPEKKLTWFEK